VESIDWSIEGITFENMTKELVKAEVIKIINDIREILSKDPNAIKVVKYEYRLL